ncbi:MAG: signal peptidase I [Dehalobacter sp.]|nr:signal peptidase I [Dehalobacter sp.]
MENEKQLPVVIVGESMYPTLRSLDVITVTPYNGQKVRRGDIIVFISPKVSNLKVAHRVVAINSNGIITRGDHSKENDAWVLQDFDVIGKVESARRNQKLIKVKNGVAGELIGLVHHIKILCKLFTRERIFVPISPPFVFIYRFLSKSGIFRIWIPGPWKPRLMTFSKPNGIEMRLLMGKRMIGICTPFSKKWIIKKPFLLFVDESLLPPLPQDPDYYTTQNIGNNVDSH